MGAPVMGLYRADGRPDAVRLDVCPPCGNPDGCPSVRADTTSVPARPNNSRSRRTSSSSELRCDWPNASDGLPGRSPP